LRFGTLLDNILPAGTGTANQVLQTNGSGAISWATGGGGSPGGSYNQMQFNSAGAFGGTGLIVWDQTNNRLSVGTGATGATSRLLVKGTGTTTGLNILAQDSTGAEKFVVLDNGNVGVGTTGPTEKIEVVGNIKLSGVIKQGNLGDLAEMMPLAACVIKPPKPQPDMLSGSRVPMMISMNRTDSVFEHPQAGDVVIVDEEGGIRRSHEPFATNVVGIISTQPGQILRSDMKNGAPVVLTGIVPCKVTAENGPVKPGDLLVSSSIPGYAMKAGKNPPVGAVIGKALTKLEKEQGTVDVLVMLR
jgi:hypothetical protein